jgi:cell wall assembly regulator SMI1
MSQHENVSDIWADIKTWLERHAPDRARELCPGAAQSAISQLEATIGQNLPGDYVASLSIHDGNASLSDYVYLPIEEIVDTWARLCDLERAGSFAGRDIDNPQAGTIRERWWHPAWIPFAKDSGGNLLCLDLDPGPHGTFGQVLRFERGMGPGPAGPSSFQAWLVGYRDGLEGGAYIVDEDGFIREAM